MGWDWGGVGLGWVSHRDEVDESCSVEWLGMALRAVSPSRGAAVLPNLPRWVQERVEEKAEKAIERFLKVWRLRDGSKGQAR